MVARWFICMSSHFLDTNKIVVNEKQRNQHEWGIHFKDKIVATHFAGQIDVDSSWQIERRFCKNII